MTQNDFLSKYITRQCLKLSHYFSLIHNGKLIIMFSNFSGTARNSREIRALCQVCKHKDVVPASSYIACEDPADSRSCSWNNSIYHFDGGL